MQLSIILSTMNEGKSKFLPLILEQLFLHPLNNTEIIAVDGGSQDETVPILSSYPIKVFPTPLKTRSERYNFGFEKANGEMILFHHPRVVIEHSSLLKLHTQSHRVIWGGFTHQFDRKHALLSWTSFYSNFIRMDRFGIVYLDHGFFAHRSLFNTRKPFKEIPIFEDTEISQHLRKSQKPIRFEQKSMVSSLRYDANGILYQMALNQVMKIAFHAKLSPEWMNSIYEKGLSLNGVQNQKKKKDAQNSPSHNR